MHFNENKYIRVSDIASYLLCPRLAYFRRRKRDPSLSPEMARSAAFKEVSRCLAAAMADASPGEALRAGIDAACADVELVYGLSAAAVRAEALGLVDDIVSGLRAEEARMGRDRLMALLGSCERKLAFYSDRLYLSGTVDRIALVDGERLPVIVSAYRPPPAGVYAADRVRLAAYAMLVEEKHGSVERGVVEYVCGWRIREVGVRKRDRLAALSARNRIRQMGSAMPDANRGAWCPGCQYAGSCTVKVAFVDSLFRPLINQ
jgi:CRISPR-associated exonuclease Cas4